MSTRAFTSDVAQLIKLVTHSIYSNPEVFIRELVSNASDALSKAKLRSLQETDYLGDQTDLSITIDVDTDAKTITLTDTGIGMTEDQVVEHIWTIAKSGTKEWISQLEQAQKNSEHGLIWQFWIGFYSAFMVADRVVLETKSNDADHATRRESAGEWSYEITHSDKTTRGTTITLYLNERGTEFADNYKLRRLIKQHSNYVMYPIMMMQDDAKDPDAKDDSPTTKSYQQVNDGIALWNKSKSQVTKEELKEFYQSISYDFADPLDHIHLNVEWAISYKSLLFLPEGQDMSAMMKGWSQDQEYGPKLYVNNVLIMEQCKDLLPVWLRRVKGVVETADLPLNVSRELLQASPVMTKIQSSLIKEVLKSLEYAKKENADHYNVFLTNYGKVLKEGIHFDQTHKEQIASLVTWMSAKTHSPLGLDDYITAASSDDTRAWSKTILYMTGHSLKELEHSPYLKPFIQQDMDVILMTDPIDERVVSALWSYKEWKLIAVTSDEAKTLLNTIASDEKKEEVAQKEKEQKDFLAHVVSIIGNDKLEAVRLTHSLGDTVGLFVTKQWDMNPQMAKYLKAMWQALPPTKRIMELNADHSLVERMMSLYQSDSKDTKLQDLIHYTYDQAVLNEWGELENIHAFLERVNGLITT